VIGPIVGLVVLLLIFWGVQQARKRNPSNAPRNLAAVQVDIATTPEGASVRVAAEQSAGVPPGPGGNEATCISNCKLALPPGAYQVSASLDGFEPAAGAVAVTAGRPAAVSLTLQPQAQSVRLLTDLDQGKVVVDDRPPADLQEGQLVLDKVAPGTHTVKVIGRNGDASFSFELANARLPAVAGPVKARNMIAVLVASFGKRARVVTNAGPWKLAVNGQPQGDAGPAGTDLTGVQPGVNEIVVGEGRDQRNMSESFGAAPMLTAFLKSDVNAGTLIVSLGQDDVRVFLNDKEYRRRTQRGQLRVPTLGKVRVRVAKSGFQDEPAQTVEVKKGAEVRLQFHLKPQPQSGSLQIHGAVAGTEVLVDQKSAGTVGPDGSFNLSAIQPGDHTIELRREQYLPKRLQRSIRAGQAVVLAGADVVLAAANGAIKLIRNPASATITYRRGDETEPHQARGNQIELPPGSYAFTASAPGFAEAAIRVQLAAGENREVEFTLARERPAAPPPVAAGGMAEFEDAQGWKKEGDSWIHKGGGFVPYKLPPKGVFTFTVQLLKGGGVFRAGQIRWCLQYLDAKNYLLSEMDRKNFWTGVIEKGKRAERVKAPHNLGNQKAFTIQIEVTPDRLVQRVRVGDEWKVLDTFAEPGRDFTQGKFGFLILGNDEIAISDFKYLPK
jgi:PEGA domain